MVLYAHFAVRITHQYERMLSIAHVRWIRMMCYVRLLCFALLLPGNDDALFTKHTEPIVVHSLQHFFLLLLFTSHSIVETEFHFRTWNWV